MLDLNLEAMGKTQTCKLYLDYGTSCNAVQVVRVRWGLPLEGKKRPRFLM